MPAGRLLSRSWLPGGRRGPGRAWPYQVGPDTEPLAEKLAKLRQYAEDVIAKVP